MTTTILFGILGILTGVLINRAAANLPPPAPRSLFTAPHCPYCASPRTLLEQSGILSFALLRDRCHACQAPLPIRAPLVELALGLLLAFLYDRYGPSLTLISYGFFTAILVLLAVIDIEHKLILNRVVLPATLLALLISPIILTNQIPGATAEPISLLILALVGAAIGYGSTIIVYLFGIAFLHLINRGRVTPINTVAFGLGDVKLAGFIGSLVGFPAIVYVLVYAIVLGGIAAFFTILFQFARRRGYSTFTAIPYGPYFISMGWIFMVWGREILRALLG